MTPVFKDSEDTDTDCGQIIIPGGTPITLTCQAFRDGEEDGEYYTAFGVDDENNEYTIMCGVVGESSIHIDFDDADNIVAVFHDVYEDCDWDHINQIELGGTVIYSAN